MSAGGTAAIFQRQTSLLSRLSLCVAATLLIGVAAGQQPSPAVHGSDPFADEHYGEPIDRVMTAYPGAHGFQHGYEDGFHYGQWDRQLNLPRRRASDLHEYRRARRGYQAGMGPAREFEAGYRKGFLAGYADALAGAAFKAKDRLTQFGPMLAAVIEHAQHALTVAHLTSQKPGAPKVPDTASPAVAVVLNWPGEFTWQSIENSFGTDLLTDSSLAQRPAP